MVWKWITLVVVAIILIWLLIVSLRQDTEHIDRSPWRDTGYSGREITLPNTALVVSEVENNNHTTRVYLSNTSSDAVKFDPKEHLAIFDKSGTQLEVHHKYFNIPPNRRVKFYTSVSGNIATVLFM